MTVIALLEAIGVLLLLCLFVLQSINSKIDFLIFESDQKKHTIDTFINETSNFISDYKRVNDFSERLIEKRIERDRENERLYR